MSRITTHAESRARYLTLLATLLAMMLVAPITQPRGLLGIVTDIVVAFLLLSAVWSVSHNLRTTVVASVLAASVFVGSNLLKWLGLGDGFAVAVLVVASVLFAYVAGLILYDVFLSTRVTVNTISGAICGYILIGVLWGYLYGIVDLLVPNAFTTSAAEGDPVVGFVYFSMVTLTTLGYGDIVPVAPAARGLAVVEATLGQVYLTVLVARLVGMHLTQRSANED